MKTLSVLEISEWAQDMILRDDDSLVQQIRTRVLPRRGVWANDDEIVITVGTQQALYLLADLLVSADTPVGMENPGYPDARNIFSSRSGRIVDLKVDEGGLVVDAALGACDYVYVTPSHQCPTTVTMPLERREALLRMADEADFILIEDDYESENRAEGEAIPALKSLDRSGRVIYIGSLSKTLAPGCGWATWLAPRRSSASCVASVASTCAIPPPTCSACSRSFSRLGTTTRSCAGSPTPIRSARGSWLRNSRHACRSCARCRFRAARRAGSKGRPGSTPRRSRWRPSPMAC